jgi:hypothetical protein
MNLIRLAAGLLAGLATAHASAYCFTIYDRQQQPVYQSTEPPFDLSQPISQGLATRFPGRFPGYHLVMVADAEDCVLIDRRQDGSGRPGDGSPALALATDEAIPARLPGARARSVVPATPGGVRSTRDGIRLRPDAQRR